VVLSARLAAPGPPSVPLDGAQRAVLARVAARLADGTYRLEPAPCPCGAARDVELARRDRYGLPVRTVLCRACGLARTDPRMRTEALRRFYEEDYRDLYTGPAARERLFEGQIALGRSILAHVGRVLPAGGTVVEVGCGPGGNLVPFAEAGYRTVGVDLGTTGFELGRARGVDLRQGDAASLLAEGVGPVDLLVLHHVLEHFEDPIEALRPIRRLLAPRGVLWVEVPGLHAIHTRYAGDFLRYLQNAHLFHFTAATLAYVLRRAGLEPVHVDEHALALAIPAPAGDRTPFPPPSGARATLAYLRRLERARTRGRRTPPKVTPPAPPSAPPPPGTLDS